MSTLLILASVSPRRRELMQQLQIPFTVVPSLYEEFNDPGRTPEDLVTEQSLGKAKAVADLHPQALVLGADTLVVCKNTILGKPGTTEEAHTMLSCMQGGWHEVHTGVALLQGGAVKVHHQTTKVRLCALTPAEITWYINTREPMDKAGGYAIQGIGSGFVEEIQGCYSNVVGLPLPYLYQELKQRGWLFGR